MKKLIPFILIFVFSITWAQQQNVVYNVSPNPIDENQSVTLSFEGSSINESTWNVTDNALYLWSWSYDINDTNEQDCPTNGSWTNSSETNRLTYIPGTDTYEISFIPSIFYDRSEIGRIGFLIKAKNGNGDKKSQDILVEVGSFEVDLITPSENSTTVLDSNSFDIQANNTNGDANYQLFANGSMIHSATTSNYSYTHTNITSNQTYRLDIIQANTTISKLFSAVVNPNVPDASIPSNLKDGLNFDANDPTKITLVLDAPNKDFIYVAGSFNNWNPGSNHAMKKDTNSTKFWLEITGLTSDVDYTFQYWVVDESPISNSPTLVKTADPYSQLVLSPFDDPGVPQTSYPNIPDYPQGQEREVTWFKTGEPDYNWQVQNFDKPKKEDLIVYEVLIRDFDANRNYQDLIDRISYFKNLNINAIQLMPIMEYEGNESWGYNTSFHMALDKFYGSPSKFKEFVDLCHQNGIAVILDIALNHATGRNPLVRMWMDDPENDGWGEPSTESPFFNTVPQHDYNVFNDFNHQSAYTQEYVKNVVSFWIEEYKIDGFRWDLTKGFTQNCGPGSSAGCTDMYQQDRVDILKEYADYSWTVDPTHYVIFEHLGGANEERQWADYRVNDAEPKGIMMWGKMTDPYAVAARGYSTDPNNTNNGAAADLSGVGSDSRGFARHRLMGYAESHDEERVLYDVMTEGNTNGENAQLLENRTKRMATVGAALITIPGPKMIWHFSDLGMENSINTCSNGNVDPNCKLDTKPQPQWTDNWLADSDRNAIYNTWARLNELKITEAVFEGEYSFNPYINNVRQRIYIWDDTLPTNSLKNVVILCNFSVANLDIQPDFPYTGTWFDLMDETGNTTLEVVNTMAPINIPAGEFRIFGNTNSTLSNLEFTLENSFKIFPNPTNSHFSINQTVSKLQIYSITGKLVRDYSGNLPKNKTFDISSLNNGMYIIKVQNNSGSFMTTKLIKT